jgi:hypothetical protein
VSGTLEFQTLTTRSEPEKQPPSLPAKDFHGFSDFHSMQFDAPFTALNCCPDREKLGQEKARLDMHPFYQRGVRQEKFYKNAGDRPGPKNSGQKEGPSS